MIFIGETGISDAFNFFLTKLLLDPQLDIVEEYQTKYCEPKGKKIWCKKCGNMDAVLYLGLAICLPKYERFGSLHSIFFLSDYATLLLIKSTF